MSNPESTTILDNYTVISPLSWPSTKRAAEDHEEFPALIRQRLRREKLLRGSVLRARSLILAPLIGDIERTNVSGINFNFCRYPQVASV